jgi:hypothetical protein
MTWSLAPCPECSEHVLLSTRGLLDLGTVTIVPHPDGPYTAILDDDREVFGRIAPNPLPPNITAWTGQAVHRHQSANPTPTKAPMSSNPTITMKLPCRLSETEEVQRARRLAQLSQQLETHDEEVRQYKASKHRERKPIYSAWLEVLTVCRTGMEQRNVEVIHKKDFQKRVINVIRADTHEVVDSHPMEEGDLQEALPLNGAMRKIEEPFESEEPAPTNEPAELGEDDRPRNPRKPRSPKLSVPS